MNLRQTIQSERVKRGLTSNALGALAGVPGVFVRSMEQGLRVPREVCEAVVKALGITVTEAQLRRGR